MTAATTTIATGARRAAATADQADLAAILQVYNDVTERLKRSHEALADEVCRLREELHEKNVELARRERLSALGQMAAGVAHEIRNPLGGIGLYASLLERDLADRPLNRTSSGGSAPESRTPKPSSATFSLLREAPRRSSNVSPWARFSTAPSPWSLLTPGRSRSRSTLTPPFAMPC